MAHGEEEPGREGEQRAERTRANVMRNGLSSRADKWVIRGFVNSRHCGRQVRIFRLARARLVRLVVLAPRKPRRCEHRTLHFGFKQRRKVKHRKRKVWQDGNRDGFNGSSCFCRSRFELILAAFAAVSEVVLIGSFCSSFTPASAVTTLVLYPLDVVKTRLNAGMDEEGVAYKGAGDVIRKQLKRKGLKGFYKGIQVVQFSLGFTLVLTSHPQVKLIQDVVRSVSFFYVFAILKGFYLKRFGRIGLRANLLLGYLSATMNLLLTMPIEVANTRQMTGASSGGFLAILVELVQKKGFTGLYTGIVTNFILCLNPAIKHMVFDQILREILRKDGFSSLYKVISNCLLCSSRPTYLAGSRTAADEGHFEVRKRSSARAY
eukprot:751314-Hanusia_phi.AAC.1